MQTIGSIKYQRKVLKSTENTRILLLPGPSDAETVTIFYTGLEKHEKE